MNRRPLGLKLDKALTGFRTFGKAAEVFSPTALDSYERILKLWLDHSGSLE